jgi:hypothetical protein
MKSRLSRQQLRDFEDFISEAYYYEQIDALWKKKKKKKAF